MIHSHVKVDRLVLKTMTVDSPKAQISGGKPHLLANAFHLRAAEDIAQFVFGVFENTLSCLRQIFSGAIDIEIQHRHCRLIRRAFAPRAPLSGAFQGKRDLTRIFFFKDIAIEIKGVAMFRYFRRPTPTALRGLLPCLAHRSVEFVGRALRCQNRRQPKRLPYNSVFFTHYT